MKLNYTPEQEKAIAHRKGNLLIIACAGSGKTEVISQRIAQMVSEGVPRKEIIAFTFTERAAHELKARVRKHLEEVNPDESSLGDMYIGTIHGFCLQLLKEIDPNYRNYEVMDEVRQAAIITANYEYFPDSDRGIGLNLLRQKGKKELRYWETLKQFKTTLGIKHLKKIQTKNIVRPELREALQRYERIVTGRPNYFFDFDTIVGELIERLSSNSSNLAKCRLQFTHLIVDEYQDVDPRQEELIQLLSDSGRQMSVCVVGDDDQAIYGWRGADIENILTFENRYPDVTRIELIKNFRSTHAIVEVANAAVRSDRLYPRLDKKMIAHYWNDGKLTERMAQQGDIQKQTFASEKEESEWVAERVGQLRGTVIIEKDGTERAIDYADMAVLLRSVRSCGQDFVDALQARKIPFVVKGTRGLFSNDEVLLIYALFCQLAESNFSYSDSNGNIQCLSVDETRGFIREMTQKLHDNGLMPQADATGLLGWVAGERHTLRLQSKPKKERQGKSRRIFPQTIFQRMLQQLGSGSGERPWPTEVLYNLGRFSNLLTQFEAVHQWVTPNELKSLCLFLGGWAAENVDDRITDEGLTPNAVQIMTIHAAKGLEWPVVFIPRISGRNFPSSLRNRGVESFLTSEEFQAKEFAGGDNGERRLWYVALTRCRKFLHLSSPDRYGKKPSPYFKEVKHDYVSEDGTDLTERHKGQPTPPIETEVLPTSFSDLNYYWKCPFDYQLRRLMGFGPSVQQDFGYGQQIHNILAEIHQRASDLLKDNPVISEDELEKLVEDRFNLRYTKGEPFEILKAAALAAITRYIREYPENVELSLEAEKPFEFIDQKSGALISGTIDLLERVYFDDSGGEVVQTPVCVIDFKSHKWNEQDITGYFERREEVTRQLRLYAAAADHLGFDPDNGAYAHFLAREKPNQRLVEQGVEERFRVDVTQADQQKVLKEVADAVTAIKLGHFPLSGCETEKCRKCDFKIICPGGKAFLD
ncbi:MAG: ATP-dependent DNA helicase [Spirulinaceae cyanobacterium]